MGSRARQTVSLLVVAILCAACSSSRKYDRLEPSVTEARLPKKPSQLVRWSDLTYHRSRERQPLENALYAIELARRMRPASTAVLWRVARLCFELSQAYSSEAICMHLSRKGIEAARQALKIDPDCVPAHYYLGLNLGIFAEAKKVGALDLIPEMEAEVLKVMKLRDSYHFGGAYRFLGMLYATAPEWPTSVGDLDKGIEVLEKGVQKYPDFPLNRLLLADCYVKDQRYADAQKQLLLVKNAEAKGEWALIRNRWHKKLQSLLKLVAEKLKTPQV